MSILEDALNSAYDAFTSGKFTEAFRLFRSILQAIPLVVVHSQKEIDDVKELLGIAKEYALAVRIELKRREEKDNLLRQNELAAYFTHCNIQPTHLKPGLKSAMIISYKLKNYNTAASFARRLLDHNLTPADASKTRQVLQGCGRAPRDAMQLNYDTSVPFFLCGSTLAPIYQGSENASCPFCAARFVPQIRGQVCPICELATVEAQCESTIGMIKRKREEVE